MLFYVWQKRGTTGIKRGRKRGKKGAKNGQKGGGEKGAPLGHAPGKKGAKGGNKGAKRGKKGASVDKSVTNLRSGKVKFKNIYDLENNNSYQMLFAKSKMLFLS